MSIESGGANAAEVEGWLALVHAHELGPALIQVGRMGRDWMSQPHTDPLSGIFLSACLWRAKGFERGIAFLSGRHPSSGIFGLSSVSARPGWRGSWNA
jgi:hypothetical protein